MQQLERDLFKAVSEHKGDTKTFRKLFNRKPKKFGLNIKDDKGIPLINMAARYGHLEIIQILAQHFNFIESSDDHGNTPLHEGAKNGCTSTTKFLLSFDIDINAQNKDGNTPCHLAAKKG